ncbi:MAG TPA: Mu transposase C-terminal domain-containing protein [Thermomicrobiaceae bacterium]|nr:Mu transposase C-terminal domain-containing protein [Thermomicrobiaceae bacterium]
MAASTALSALTDAQRDQALRRYTLLRPHLEEGVPLPALAREHGVSLRTLERWLRGYRRAGLAGLVRQPRADGGSRRFPDTLVQLIEGLALRRPAPTLATVHRQAARVAAREGWPAPSYSTVYAIVRALPPALVTLAHDGTKAYREQFDLLYRQEADGPNATWQADHTPLDLWVRDEHDRPVKPWLTVILDDYSRAVAGYRLSLADPTALHTALALRDGIWRKAEPSWHVCGIPDVFYTDHGSDFTSHHLEQVALDLRMELVFSTVGMPRGRGTIERFFATVDQLFLATQPGYTPAGTAPPPVTGLLMLPELDARLRIFLVEDYHQRRHSETGMAPQARWDAGGFLPRLPESLEQLDLLLLTVAKPRVVHPDGIHFQGLRYLDPTLAAYVGDPVTIRYDLRDLAEIRVFHHDRFLCRAICPELAGTTISLKDIVQARQARQRALAADLRTRQSLVDALLTRVAETTPVTTPEVSIDDDVPDRAGPRLKRYRDE